MYVPPAENVPVEVSDDGSHDPGYRRRDHRHQDLGPGLPHLSEHVEGFPPHRTDGRECEHAALEDRWATVVAER